jgi:hypothetical protein
MRWEDNFSKDCAPTFRNDVTLSGNIGFAALRLRAKLHKLTTQQTFPWATRGTPIPILLAEQD